jgi:hypothetical protein
MVCPRILTIVAVLTIASSAPAAAQSAPPIDGDVLEVTGVEYAYVGLATSVPVGTSLRLRNDGTEVHEILLYRVEDGVTETLGELLAMGDAEAAGLVELVGPGPLLALPGVTADGTLPLEREGRYAIVCFIPQGLTAEILEGLGPDPAPEDLPPELQASPPHVALGMVQEFMVTLPSSIVALAPHASATAPGSAPPIASPAPAA